MRSKRLLIIAAAVAIVLSSYAPLLSAQTRASTKQSDETARAENAASVLSEIMEAPDCVFRRKPPVIPIQSIH